MNWVCLYCVETNGRPWLFYGYATRAEGLPPSGWRRQQVATFNGVELVEFQRAADDAAVAAFRAGLHQATTTIDLGGGQSAAVEHGGLKARPDVFACPKTPDPAGVPVSLSDQLATAGTHWQLAPAALVRALYAHPALPPDEREDCLSRILTRIGESTGVDFLGHDAGRFGNFEDIRFLLGSYDQPDGLCHHPERATDQAGASVVCWIEPPLSASSPLLIGCRLFSGPPRDGRTLVLDVVRRWPGPGAAPLRFTAAEPITSYELSVWAEEGGKLLARQDHWVLREVATGLALDDPARAVTTAWDREFTEPLRQRVAAETGVTHSPLVVGGYRRDPWVEAEDRKRSFLRQLGPGAGTGRFFPAGQDHHVETILFLARLMIRREVRRVVIADPYLDKAAVESLLVRIRDVPELVVLSSHDRPAAEPDDGWWKGSPAKTACHWLTAAENALFGRTAPPATEEPTAGLVRTCEQYRAALPDRVTVVNVRHANGAGRKFHDRAVLVDLEHGVREVWSLTNSLSMLARRYPLLVTRVPPEVARSVAEHLAQLERGQVPGQPDLVADVLWQKPAPGGGNAPPTTANRPGFGSHERVLALLAPDVPAQERLGEALARGLLEPEAGPGQTTWRVPDPRLAEVAAACALAVQAGNADAVSDLRALGEWEYFGGPDLSAYAFDAPVVPAAEAALRAVLTDSPEPPTRSPLDVSRPATFPECLDELRLFVIQHAPMDYEPRGVPGLQFAAGILWRLAPDRLVAVAEGVGGRRLTGWLAAEASQLVAAQSQALLQSENTRVVALGVVLLWDRTFHGLAAPGPRTAAVEAELAAAHVPQLDRFLAELALTVPACPTAAALGDAVAACLNQAPAALDEPAFERLVSILSIDGPVHRIVRVEGLAKAVPTAAVAARLHQWCVDEVLSHLHFRNAPPPIRDNKSPRWKDAAVPAAFAGAWWRRHGAQAPALLATDVLRRLHVRAVDAPLYPTRDYSRWSELVSGLLWGIRLGVAVVGAATPADRPAALQRIFPELIRLLEVFRPGLWHRYGDFDGLLAATVDTLSAWTDDPTSAPAHRVAWDALVARPVVPGLWRIRAVLASKHLTQLHAAQLPAWAADPSSSPSLTDLPRRAATRAGFNAAVAARKADLTALAATLDAAASALTAWWDARYPA